MVRQVRAAREEREKDAGVAVRRWVLAGPTAATWTDAHLRAEGGGSWERVNTTKICAFVVGSYTCSHARPLFYPLPAPARLLAAPPLGILPAASAPAPAPAPASAAPQPPPDLCAFPETLCSPEGRLLKLSLTRDLACTQPVLPALIASSTRARSLNVGGVLGSLFSGDLAAAVEAAVHGGAAAEDLTAAAIRSLANLPDLAWLDLSGSELGVPYSAFRPLLSRPGLVGLLLAGTGLTGELAPTAVAAPPPPPSPQPPAWWRGPGGRWRHGGGWRQRMEGSSLPLAPTGSPYPGNTTTDAGDGSPVSGLATRALAETDPLVTGTNSTDGGGGGGGGGGRGGAEAAGPCAGVAPRGLRVLVLSGNALRGPLPGCLAEHGELQELQTAENAGLTGGSWVEAIGNLALWYGCSCCMQGVAVTALAGGNSFLASRQGEKPLLPMVGRFALVTGLVPGDTLLAPGLRVTRLSPLETVVL